MSSFTILDTIEEASTEAESPPPPTTPRKWSSDVDLSPGTQSSQSIKYNPNLTEHPEHWRSEGYAGFKYEGGKPIDVAKYWYFPPKPSASDEKRE
ncbi:hypothetical protein IAR55_002060 [Kwoniella newhampshirensis]|uniref:Uncharacterized protein n=1 Tax=Kwoniella newhampshirensis TaxID=1651941 RepID=A0AAW0YYI3_9TREE